MAVASFARLCFSWNAVHQMLSLVPCAVTVDGAPGRNRWGVAETPLPAKTQGRNMDCLFQFNVSVSGAGCCLSVSRWGGQRPRYREHEQSADAVSTGPQQAHETQRDPSARQQADPIREPGECPRSTSFKRSQPSGDRPQERRATIPKNGGHRPNDGQAAYFLTWPPPVLASLRGCSGPHCWRLLALSVTSRCFDSTWRTLLQAP